MNKDAQGRWKVGMSNIKSKMRDQISFQATTHIIQLALGLHGIFPQFGQLYRQNLLLIRRKKCHAERALGG